MARHFSGARAPFRPGLLACLMVLLLPAPALAQRVLTFEERVAAQEAIERVYYGYQTGAVAPFEAAVPRAVVERKVRTALAQSAALEALWGTPVTAAMLRAELERIVASTRFPARLRQVSAALGDDPFLLQECLARPVLVDRLSHSFLAGDERARGRGEVRAAAGESASRRGWDEWWGTARLGFEEVAVAAVAGDPGPRASAFLQSTRGPAVGESAPESCTADDTWDNGSLDDAATGNFMVWTGTVAIVWGKPTQSGAIYDPLTDTWRPTTRVGAPPEAWLGVWTGTHLLVWSDDQQAGALYEPTADIWTPISSAGAPSARHNSTAVWSGSELLVWGGGVVEGGELLRSGGRYRPATDTWSPISNLGTPSPRQYHSAVWAGGRMIVWGGWDGTSYVASGGRYDPATDTWQPISATGAPPPRADPAVVAAGARMVVWLGTADGIAANNGGRYDPATDTWQAISTAGSPVPRTHASAVWTGSRFVVWGGWNGSSGLLTSGGRYDPVTDVWESMDTTNTPTARMAALAIWTGDRMIVWQGSTNPPWDDLETGGRYDPVADVWTPMSSPSPALRRRDHTAVWTGNLMVVWGGRVTTLDTATGERYDPLTDSWTPVATASAPAPRSRHNAVWTGREMIAWGGNVGGGGRYDPVADEWDPVATALAPALREATAVWTGTRMLVWGEPVVVTGLAAGGSYDPYTDAWTPITTENAPSVRREHSAAWTGSRMIVWGGRNPTVPFVHKTGGLYDPVSDTWTETEWHAAETPEGRAEHVAAWTGSQMVIWGGWSYVPAGTVRFAIDTGARYDPETDTWQPTAPAGAPSPRWGAAAVWTGNRLIAWGGEDQDGSQGLGSGGRYDPAADAWEPVSEVLAPASCAGHTAVWTGGSMLVWGGHRDGSVCGGRYALGQSADLDADGVTWCGGDCDDTSASVHPGAAEICDGADSDCDGAAPGESDVDLDGWHACGGDCDDLTPTTFPGAPEVCDNVDNDCNATIDAFPTACGVGACAAAGICTAGVDSCAPGAPAAEACNGIDDDCNGSLPVDESDLDADGISACAGDCNDADPATYPDAPEIHDAMDNQCAGDEGFGLVDEVSGTTGFTSPTGLCWPAQAGGTRYEVLRSSRRDLSVGCVWQSVSGPCWSDTIAPAGGGRFHYLVRAIAPGIGSWGANSAGSERDGDCDGFHLVDTPGDDAAAMSLHEFFATTPALPSDYLHVSLSGGGVEAYEWCAQRADFYRDGYLLFASGGGTATAEGWEIWHRLEGGDWTGPLSTFNDSYFGNQCLGAYSWCPEVLLTDRAAVVAPSEGAACEAQDLTLGCGDGTWVFTVSIGPERMTACGF